MEVSTYDNPDIKVILTPEDANFIKELGANLKLYSQGALQEINQRKWRFKSPEVLYQNKSTNEGKNLGQLSDTYVELSRRVYG